MASAIPRIDQLQTPENTLAEPGQLNLFPLSKLHVVTRQETNRRPIKMPRSVLTITPDEQLSNYLSRVANAAMKAATQSYGSSTLAATRLGTSEQDPEPAEPRPALKLASSKL